MTIEQSKRVVHIATVGRLPSVNADPNQISDPISFAIYQERYAEGRAGRFPDIIYLLYTSGSQETARILQQKLQAIGIPPANIQLEEVDPFSFETIKNIIAGILDKELQAGAKIIVNFTSGTGPMQAAALTKAVDFQLLYGSAVDLEIIYVKEFKDVRPSDPAQRGTRETMALGIVSPFQLYYEHLFARGRELLHNFEYERARAYFEQASWFASEAEQQARAQDYARLCQAYIFWEQFYYGAALQKLRSLAGYLDNELEQYADTKKEFLEELLRGPERPLQFFYVADMLERAVRDWRRGRKHDVAIKIFRFFEMLLEWRLGQAYGFFNDPDKDDQETQKQWQKVATCYRQKMIEKTGRLNSINQVKKAEEKVRRFRLQGRGQQGGLYYYVDNLQKILECLHDPLYQEVNKQMNQLTLTLTELRNLRNQSPLTHGYRGIDVEKGIFKGEQTIRHLIRVSYQLIDFLIKQEALNTKEWQDLQIVLRPFDYDPLAICGE